MFTGIIREVGEIEAVEGSVAGARIGIRTSLGAELQPGDSVAVSGACLTVSDRDGRGFAADVMNQTLALTTLGDLDEGDRVNLEPALRAGEPLGGHLVQGHVDAAAEVVSVVPDGIARRVRVALPDEVARYVVERGSIAVDGVSLTVADLAGGAAEVSLIPETVERSTLGRLEPGDRVNVEVDQVARYVERLMPSFGGENDD